MHQPLWLGSINIRKEGNILCSRCSNAIVRKVNKSGMLSFTTLGCSRCSNKNFVGFTEFIEWFQSLPSEAQNMIRQQNPYLIP